MIRASVKRCVIVFINFKGIQQNIGTIVSLMFIEQYKESFEKFRLQHQFVADFR